MDAKQVTQTLAKAKGVKVLDASGKGYDRIARESDGRVVCWVCSRKTGGARMLALGEVEGLDEKLAAHLVTSTKYSSLVVRDDDLLQESILVLRHMLEATPVRGKAEAVKEEAKPKPSGKRARPRAGTRK